MVLLNGTSTVATKSTTGIKKYLVLKTGTKKVFSFTTERSETERK